MPAARIATIASEGRRRAQHAAEAESQVVQHAREYRTARRSIVRYTFNRDVAAAQ
jgi:hypothetical protein